jgi:hypothetical protein
MSWSYSGNPSGSSLDAVRFLIGDTVASAPRVSDEEINFNISMAPSSIYLAAAYAADGVAARSASSVDKSVGDLRLSYSQQATAFRDLANSLRRRATLNMVQVYVGGISVSDKALNDGDGDVVQPGIKIGAMNIPQGAFPTGGGVPEV